MANPRKFSEKIALMKEKESESNAAFSRILTEVSPITRQIERYDVPLTRRVGPRFVGCGLGLQQQQQQQPLAAAAAAAAGASSMSLSHRRRVLQHPYLSSKAASLPNINASLLHSQKTAAAAATRSVQPTTGGSSMAAPRWHATDVQGALGRLEGMVHPQQELQLQQQLQQQQQQQQQLCSASGSHWPPQWPLHQLQQQQPLSPSSLQFFNLMQAQRDSLQQSSAASVAAEAYLFNGRHNSSTTSACQKLAVPSRTSCADRGAGDDCGGGGASSFTAAIGGGSCSAMGVTQAAAEAGGGAPIAPAWSGIYDDLDLMPQESGYAGHGLVSMRRAAALRSRFKSEPDLQRSLRRQQQQLLHKQLTLTADTLPAAVAPSAVSTAAMSRCSGMALEEEESTGSTDMGVANQRPFPGPYVVSQQPTYNLTGRATGVEATYGCLGMKHQLPVSPHSAGSDVASDQSCCRQTSLTASFAQASLQHLKGQISPNPAPSSLNTYGSLPDLASIRSPSAREQVARPAACAAPPAVTGQEMAAASWCNSADQSSVSPGAADLDTLWPPMPNFMNVLPIRLPSPEPGPASLSPADRRTYFAEGQRPVAADLSMLHRQRAGVAAMTSSAGYGCGLGQNSSAAAASPSSQDNATIAVPSIAAARQSNHGTMLFTSAHAHPLTNSTTRAVPGALGTAASASAVAAGAVAHRGLSAMDDCASPNALAAVGTELVGCKPAMSSSGQHTIGDGSGSSSAPNGEFMDDELSSLGLDGLLTLDDSSFRVAWNSTAEDILRLC